MSHLPGSRAVVSVFVFIVGQVVDEEVEEVRSAVDWAEVRAMHADGTAKREIARRAALVRPDGVVAWRARGPAGRDEVARALATALALRP